MNVQQMNVQTNQVEHPNQTGSIDPIAPAETIRSISRSTRVKMPFRSLLLLLFCAIWVETAQPGRGQSLNEPLNQEKSGQQTEPKAEPKAGQKSGQKAGSQTAAARPVKPRTAITEIRAVLDAQVAAWNAGKLEEFMDGYWRSPELTFFSGGRKLTGWEATLERYRQSYQAGGKEMGKLDFSDLDLLPLSDHSAVVRGRWKLILSDGKELGGLYTLIFRRFKSGWKITHDHTSSNQ